MKILNNDEKLKVLRTFKIHGAVEQALHWVIASDIDWTSLESIQTVMGVFFDNDQGLLDERYMWVRAYALINVIHSEHSDCTRIIKAFVDLMETTQKTKFFPSLAFEGKLKETYLKCLPNNPKIRFFTLIANKMYKSAYDSLASLPMNDTEDLAYFKYLADSLKKYLNLLIDIPSKIHYVHVKEPEISRLIPVRTTRPQPIPIAKKLF